VRNARSIIIVAGVAAGVALAGAARAAAPSTRPVPVYGGGTDALPNRLNAALFARVDRAGRQVGLDEVDPLLWQDTKHLSTGPSNEAALELLGALTSRPAGEVATSPVERAILQNDLWAAFDWADQSVAWEDDAHSAAAAGRRALRRRLAAAIRHVALPDAEIARLPDNYRAAVDAKAFAPTFDPAAPDRPFLPADLLDPAGPWVCVGTPRAEGVAAANHARFFGGRSAFLVFVNLPGGRAATGDYLKAVSAFPNPVTRRSRTDSPSLVDGLPQFPAGTLAALVRRMLLVDARGRVTPTPVTQSVQLRAFLRVRPGLNQLPIDQRFFEFTFNRRSLFPGGGGLRLVGPDEEAVVGFNGMLGNEDPFESPEPGRHRPMTVMKTCAACHAPSGIYSVNTFSPSNGAAKPDPHLLPVTPEEETRRAVLWKSQQKDFGVLQGLSEAAGVP
jgi:hypothetical protein